MKETLFPEYSKCDRCGEDVRNGFINWIKHFDICSPMVKEITVEMLSDVFDKMGKQKWMAPPPVMIDEGYGYINIQQSNLFNNAIKAEIHANRLRQKNKDSQED